MTCNGTPKTLEEALSNGFVEILTRPTNPIALTDPSGPAIHILHDHIRDFAAQSFTSYMVRYPDSSSILKALYDNLFREEHGIKPE